MLHSCLVPSTCAPLSNPGAASVDLPISTVTEVPSLPHLSFVMATHSRHSIYSLTDSLSPTDQELFLLFLQYPEIDFDSNGSASTSDEQKPEAVPEAVPDVGSSPSSNGPAAASSGSTLIDYTDTGFAWRAAPVKTTQAIPIFPDITATSDWNDFVQLVQHSDLPEECLRYYTSLGQSIVHIGAQLNATAKAHQSSNLLQVATALFENATYSCRQTAAQVEKIASLKTLVAFNTNPTGPYIWTAYMQRMKLITMNLALPSRRELDFVDSLVLTYSAHVYDEFVFSVSANAVDRTISGLIHDIYNILMTWLQSYKQWCNGMKELRYRYMKPLIHQFTRQLEAQRDFVDFQDRLDRARKTLRKPVDSNGDLSDKMVQTLNLSARRPGPATSSKRTRTRYKREHTL